MEERIGEGRHSHWTQKERGLSHNLDGRVGRFFYFFILSISLTCSFFLSFSYLLFLSFSLFLLLAFSLSFSFAVFFLVSRSVEPKIDGTDQEFCLSEIPLIFFFHRTHKHTHTDILLFLALFTVPLALFQC